MGFRQGKRETKTFAGNGGKNIRESTSTLVACEATPKARKVPCRVETRGAAQGLQGPQGPHGAHQRAGPECAQLAQPPEAPPSASTTCASRGVRPSLPSPPARPRCGHGGRGGGRGGAAAGGLSPTGGPGQRGPRPGRPLIPPDSFPRLRSPVATGHFCRGRAGVTWKKLSLTNIHIRRLEIPSHWGNASVHFGGIPPPLPLRPHVPPIPASSFLRSDVPPRPRPCPFPAWSAVGRPPPALHHHATLTCELTDAGCGLCE